MTDAFMNFGEYIKLLRLQRRLSLVKAAKRMGFSSQKLCDIEMGRRYKRSVNLNLVNAIGKAYSVPVAEIIRNTETAISHDKTVAEILDEIGPKARFAELLGDSLLAESRKFAPEIETKCVELVNTVKEIRGLLSLLRKRHYKSDPGEEKDVMP